MTLVRLLILDQGLSVEPFITPLEDCPQEGLGQGTQASPGRRAVFETTTCPLGWGSLQPCLGKHASGQHGPARQGIIWVVLQVLVDGGHHCIKLRLEA